LQSEPSQALNGTVTPFVGCEKPQVFPEPAACLVKNTLFTRSLRVLPQPSVTPKDGKRHVEAVTKICFYWPFLPSAVSRQSERRARIDVLGNPKSRCSYAKQRQNGCTNCNRPSQFCNSDFNL
jgi:hypothetical protein